MKTKQSVCDGIENLAGKHFRRLGGDRGQDLRAPRVGCGAYGRSVGPFVGWLAGWLYISNTSHLISSSRLEGREGSKQKKKKRNKEKKIKPKKVTERFGPYFARIP